MLLNQYLPALKVQISHLVLCMIWNAVGVVQIAYGIQSIGPVASIAAIIVMMFFSALLYFSLKKGFEKTYLVASVLPALLAVMTIYGAFTNDPSLWPAEFWRYAGAVVNSVGVIGFAMLVKIKAK